MAQVLPFRGVRYNPEKVGDLALVICPPYDVIDPSLNQELLQRSPYNFARIECAEPSPRPIPHDDRYSLTRELFKNWLEQGVFTIEPSPLFYLYHHYFPYQGKVLRRRSLFARVRIEEWEKRVIRPHEGTLSAPKDERFRLLSALKVNTSPILALYQDPEHELDLTLSQLTTQTPDLDIDMGNSERHIVWSVNEATAIADIAAFFTPRPLYIADGHHRYESALRYKREQHLIQGESQGEVPSDFVMMALSTVDDPGLLVLSPHRLLRGLDEGQMQGLRQGIEELFVIEEIAADVDNPWALNEWLQTNTGPAIALFGLEPGRILGLCPRDMTRLEEMMPPCHCATGCELSVSVSDYILLEGLLGVNHGNTDIEIAYCPDTVEAIRSVVNKDYQLACLLSPTQKEAIIAMADAGELMPRKSTYFYPKVPSGLVLYPLEY